MIRWQYKTLTYVWDDEKQDLVWGDTKDLVVNAQMVDKRLNELGDEGWELLCIEKVGDIARVAVNFYLKRQKEAEELSRIETISNELHIKNEPGNTDV